MDTQPGRRPARPPRAVTCVQRRPQPTRSRTPPQVRTFPAPPERPHEIFLRDDAEQYGWDQAASAGLIATCPVTELEFFHSARSAADRARGIEDMRMLFGWVPVDDRAYDRAWQVQELLTQRGQHRSAGAVDLVVAATAELQGLTLLHRDHDFECIAAVTGQAMQWYGPVAGK